MEELVTVLESLGVELACG